jgi:hypothetical protein
MSSKKRKVQLEKTREFQASLEILKSALCEIITESGDASFKYKMLAKLNVSDTENHATAAENSINAIVNQYFEKCYHAKRAKESDMSSLDVSDFSDCLNDTLDSERLDEHSDKSSDFEVLQTQTMLSCQPNSQDQYETFDGNGEKTANQQQKCYLVDEFDLILT